MIETFLVLASVYWEDKFVSTGERFKPLGLTVAHRELPLGTCIKIKRDILWTTALVNDRGPCYEGAACSKSKDKKRIQKREMDLSLGVAIKLGMNKNSLNKIRYWIVDKKECKKRLK